MAKTKEAYLTHRAGSHKGEVHRIFDKDGREAAVKAGLKFDLKPATLAVWTSTWTREAMGSKGKGAARKAPAKSKGKATARKGAVKGATSGKKPAAKSMTKRRGKAPVKAKLEPASPAE